MDKAAAHDAHGRDDEEIGREASLWLIRLEDEGDNPALRSEFAAWLGADARHARAWQAVTHTAQVIAAARPVPHQAPALRRERRWSRATHPGIYRSVRAWSAMAASVAAGLALWLAAPEAMVRWQADQLTDVGEVRSVRLADGSMVTMAPASAIRVTMGGGRRDVQLLRGEAYFDVAHDAAHPFRVFVGAGQVRVLGTAFDVRRGDRQSAVAVNRGIVEVSVPGQAGVLHERLIKGQSLAFDTQGQTTRGAVQTAHIGGWRQGQIMIDNQPVRDVVAALRPWSKGLIILRGPGAATGAATRRVSGLYRLSDPAGALAALAKVRGVFVTSVSPWLTLVTVR